MDELDEIAKQVQQQRHTPATTNRPRASHLIARSLAWGVFLLLCVIFVYAVREGDERWKEFAVRIYGYVALGVAAVFIIAVGVRIGLKR